MAVLVAYDGSDPAKKAVEHAVSDHSDEEIILLRVIEVAESSTEAGIGLFKEGIKKARRRTEHTISDEVADLLESNDLEVGIETVVGKPSREIVKFAEENDIDHIIIGNHGREGVSRVLLGSVAERVARRASVPVTIVR